MDSGVCDIKTAKLSYRLYGGRSNPPVIVETAMGACSAEWWHLAERWSGKYCVLVYDRAGYGLSSNSALPRTPANVATELKRLLHGLGITNRIILIGHSLGGLYSQQFVRLFPNKVQALVLLDPVSANNTALRQRLSKREYAQSGIDKGRNLRLGLLVCTLRLGFLFKPLLRKAPPFHYFNGFSKDAEGLILRNSTQWRMYQNALAEYRHIDCDEAMKALREKDGFPDIPLALICHTPEVMIAEIEKYGGADKATATKIDGVWLSLMKEYLRFSARSTFRQARNSGHMIHLSDPDIIWEALCSVA